MTRHQRRPADDWLIAADASIPLYERWARIVEAMAPGDGGEVDADLALIASLIRLRAVDDPYAAARIIRSFKIGRDADHDDAVEAAATSVRTQAVTTH